MQITLLAPGKLKDPSLKALYEEYKKRLDWKLTLVEDLTKSFLNSSFLITLDEHGEALTSQEFAALLQEIQLHAQGKVTFVIGSSEGITPEIKKKASRSLSFGRLTWPHLFVRVMLVEQLYRAQQILKNHPYHRNS